jgi:alpha-L-fucosidase
MTAPAAAPKVPPWFRDARLGMFIHWGLYSMLEHGEQPLFREFLNPSEYRALADRWRPTRYDPAEWAATAKAAEMQYMVLTTRHHDGFCLWDTATTDYNSARRAAKRDLVGEYVEACRAAGLRVGLYYSVPDWNDAGYMAGPQRDPRGFRNCIRIMWRQLEELVTRYGRIDLLWFDASNFPTAAQLRSTQLVRMLRSHQPDLLINNRLRKPRKGGAWGYETPEQRIGAVSTAPWESCITATRKFWGYHKCHADPGQWYSERELLNTFTSIITRGGRLLLNVGPRANGALPKLYKERSAALGRWVRANREAVYGTEPFSHEFAYGGVLARKGRKLYLFFQYWPGREFSMPGFNERLLSARFVDGGRRVKAAQEPHRIVLKEMPEKSPDLVTVVELTFNAPPTTHPWAAHRLHNYPMPPLVEWLKL